MTVASIRSQIANAIQLIVQLQRQSDGRRKVTSIAEVTGLEGDIIQMHEIYRFVKESTDESGNIRGSFKATGVRPHFLANIKAYGIEVSAAHFDPARPL